MADIPQVNASIVKTPESHVFSTPVAAALARTKKKLPSDAKHIHQTLHVIAAESARPWGLPQRAHVSADAQQKCDGVLPCSSCLRRGRASECHFDPGKSSISLILSYSLLQCLNRQRSHRHGINRLPQTPAPLSQKPHWLRIQSWLPVLSWKQKQKTRCLPLVAGRDCPSSRSKILNGRNSSGASTPTRSSRPGHLHPRRRSH